jgi:meso-butanediol dehydrogenase / (S,S)-butanediol dehydrogenase / diacetyl reductase
MNGLLGKSAIVTGGARGIGYAIASRLLSEGAVVTIMALHQDSVDRAVASLSAKGRVIGIIGDVSVERDMRKGIDAAVSTFGRLDIMVNNAGTIAVGNAVDLSVDDWDRVMAVNLRGCFLGCREAARQMIAQRAGGRIVNGSSGAGRRGGALTSAYSASKFGVIGLTQSLAEELAPHGITVNAYCPGHVTATPMWDFIDREMASLTGGEVGSAKRAAENESPLRRAGEADEIAAAVAFLASDEASFITGHSLLIDGGLVRF